MDAKALARQLQAQVAALQVRVEKLESESLKAPTLRRIGPSETKPTGAAEFKEAGDFPPMG